MKTVITSFSNFTSAEGETVGFTYSQIDDDGIKVKENVKQSLVLINDEQLELVRALKSFLLEKIK